MQVRHNTAPTARHARSTGPTTSMGKLLAGVGTAAIALGVGAVVATPVAAASVTSAVFSGAAGTVSVGGTLYAKQGATLTLTVVTSSDTKCVDVTGTTTLPRQTSTIAKANWTFTTTAPAGNSAQAFTVAASPNFNTNGCTGQTNSTQAAYTLDNTGPVVSAVPSPAPNSAGWNNTEVTVRWSASDTGSGVSGTQPFKTDTVSANGAVDLTAPAQSDRLGNTGAPGAVSIRVDKANPSITAQQTKNADGTTTITFTCGDAHSGVSSCVADGSTTNAKTVQPGVTVTGTATDKAGNTSTASSTAPKGDTTAPTLTGAPTTQPNSAGWYRDDVTVHWTAADPESGIPSAPIDTTITGEGRALTSSTTVSNGAGLTTSATSAPPVDIDRTAPITAISGGSNTWVNGDVTLTLAASDGLSGVASTTYTVDGGAPRTGTSIVLDTEGEHIVTYSSTDRAGNTEAVRTATVKIDKTAPTISHAFDPTTYEDGAWTNGQVTVTFICADQGGSSVAGCSAPVTKSAEGDHRVTGTATDGAGNTSTDTASVRIDTTPPVVTAEAIGDKNAAGWYRNDVRVEYTANDALSGVASAPDADVLGEGRAQKASGTATDRAGNESTAGVSGINVDKTAPTLKGSFTGGWHTDDVTVAWTCSDSLSGPAAQPADSVVNGEGANLTATASCEDEAGNTTTETVAGIQIDRHAPTTSATVAETATNGWYRGTATVTLTAADNLSGVATTSYSINDGLAATYDGPIKLTEDGQYSLSFYSKDGARNVEKASAPLVVKVDGTAPQTKVINPISPDSGWFVTSGIPFAFTATDSHSGVAATYYAIDGGEPLSYGTPFTEDLTDGTHSVAYWSEDAAGNVEEKQGFQLSVDTLKPKITGETVGADGKPRLPNASGWFNSAVDVKFTCTDEGSGLAQGVAGCAGDTRLVNEGAGQLVVGDAVDVAGNRNSLEFGPVNIDTTAPTLTGVPSAANAAGWHKGDVTVTWVGDDALSGIDPATQPAPSTVGGEGANLSAGPVTIRDKAGNTSVPATVDGIRIDRTAPVVDGGATTRPNASGWYSGEVVVDFTCTDALSGVASCPTSQVIKGDGANQSVTSGPATDAAGNESKAFSVGGINIDGAAPSTSSNNTCTASNGWCTGATADVVLSATDQVGLSGVKEIHYRVDGGAEQVAPGNGLTVKVPLDGSGAGTVSYWAVDKAGNAEKANSVALKWDNIAPTVSHSLSPAPNADDWNNADVTVKFTAKDDDKGSGVASVTGPVTIFTETDGTEVIGTAVDTAGNTGTDKVIVKLDKGLPTITGAVTSGTRTASGWFNGPVTVTFTCKDTLSGVATCPDPVTLTANGENAASGTVTDKAGNTATARYSGIQIDQEKPTLTTAGVNVQGGKFTLGSVPAASCTATDSFSGLAGCTVTTSSGNANGVGTIEYVATATDKVGNVTTVKGSYQVVYRFDGFLQPINDTAHQVGTSTSVFKAGSTVPTKLQLKKSDGTALQAVAAPVWLTPVKGSSMSAPVDESVYSASADSGTTFRHDAASGQYIYNWKTGSAGGSYWRVGVKLDDGETYYVNIGTR